MADLPLAVAVVGGRAPDWARGAARDLLLVAPGESGSPEDGFNALLARTTAPYLLTVQSDDELDPAGLSRLCAALDTASACVAGASGDTDRGPAVHLPGAAVVPHPLVLRVGALRAAGGWRPGEARWGRLQARHRPLLERMGARVIAVHASLGRVASPSAWAPVAAPDPVVALIYQPVVITCKGFRAEGRLAAVSPDLLTLAGPGGEVILVPRRKALAVAPARASQERWP